MTSPLPPATMTSFLPPRYYGVISHCYGYYDVTPAPRYYAVTPPATVPSDPIAMVTMTSQTVHPEAQNGSHGKQYRAASGPGAERG